MQLFGKEYFRLSEKETLSGLKSSLTYWKTRKEDEAKYVSSFGFQLVNSIYDIEYIFQNNKD